LAWASAGKKEGKRWTRATSRLRNFGSWKGCCLSTAATIIAALQRFVVAVGIHFDLSNTFDWFLNEKKKIVGIYVSSFWQKCYQCPYSVFYWPIFHWLSRNSRLPAIFCAAGHFVLLLQEHCPRVRAGVLLVLFGLQRAIPVRSQFLVLQLVQFLLRLAPLHARLFRPGRKTKVHCEYRWTRSMVGHFVCAWQKCLEMNTSLE